jgi:predicted transcriptional regulator
MAKQVKIDIVARDKTKRAIESSKKGLGGLKTFALAASSALATIGAGRVISNLVNVGKEMESLQVRFKFLFGSVEEGNIAFDNLSKFASKVPFALNDIAMASGNLAVVAKDAKDLTRILEITGNVAAFTGLDFQTTASQIQRAFSGGIAAADIFREKGLRQVLGFSEGAKVSIEETQKKFEEIFGKDGRLGKVTDDLAQTFEGTLSMIQDKFLNFQMAVNKAFFAELKKQFGNLNETLEANEKSIEKFGENVGESLATSLGDTIIVLDFFNEAVKLSNRLLSGEAGGGDRSAFSKQLLLMMNQGKLFGAVLHEMIATLGDYANIFKEIAPIQETFDHQLKEHKASLAAVSETTEEAEVAVKDMTLAMSLFDEQLNQQKQSLASVDEEYLKIIESLGLLNDAQIKVMNGFEAQKQASRDAHATEVQTAEEAANKNLEAFKKGEFGKIDMKKLTDKQLGQMGRSALQEGAKINKEMFRLNQALMIGEAIMNTSAGVTKALAQGGMFAIPAAIAIGAMGAVQVATIMSQQPPAQFGGVRQSGSPFLVGERGPELFTPATAGTVTPNHQLGGGGATVNFNITTVDAQSFGALLDTRRGQIVNMINTALNNKGQAALV